MEKHIPIVGILNIVYRSLGIFCALILFALSFGFRYIFEIIFRFDHNGLEELPVEILNIIPILFIIIGTVILIINIVGLIGAIGLMRRKEWGRITVLIVSFFSLVSVPLGTLLGIYSMWVLFNDEVIRLLNPVKSHTNEKTTE